MIKIWPCLKFLNTLLLNIITKNSISDIVVALDSSLEQVSLADLLQTQHTILYSNRFSNFYPFIFSDVFSMEFIIWFVT